MGLVDKIRSQNTIYEREDFIDDLIDSELTKEEKEEITPFIISYFHHHSDWTLVLLIDLSSSQELVSEELLKTYMLGLLDGKNLYVKLSILDYISTTGELYEQNGITVDLSIINDLAYLKTERFVVRNQALLTLMKLQPERSNEILLQLKENLKKTNDYRAHIRFYNTLLVDDLSEQMTTDNINYFLDMSQSKSLGRALDKKIEEFKSIVWGNI